MPTVSFNTHFPGYNVLGEISRSNARVLKARHIDSGDLVAIKHFALNTDADTLRRFERESTIMTRMEHPNIVRVREVRLEAELPYIVMDYVEGGSVRQLLETQGNLSVELTIRLGLQVLNAFRLIHAQGIVHRDVKPENILYHRLASGELHFLLTDFGVARLHEQRVTVTGQSLMTYEYAAPEQFDNPRQVNEETDYYGLGVVLYECLTGHVPFPMDSQTGIVTFMNTVMHNPVPPPALPNGQFLPGSLENLLRQLLAKNPAERLHNPDTVKLLLKQAEVEDLNREAGQTGVVSATRPEPVRTAAPVEPQFRKEPSAPAATTRQTQPLPSREPVQTRSSRPVVPMAILAGAVALAGVWAYLYFRNPDSTTNPSSTVPQSSIQQSVGQGTEPTGVIGTTEVTDLTVPPEVRRAEEEKLRRARVENARRQYQQQASSAWQELEATTFGGKAGIFGGVKGLQVRLKNPTSISFKSVRVQVEYVKDNGETFKSPIMYFNNLKPGGSITRKAPDSNRGTKFRARVLRGDPAPFVDSLSTPMIQTPQ